MWFSKRIHRPLKEMTHIITFCNSRSNRTTPERARFWRTNRNKTGLITLLPVTNSQWMLNIYIYLHIYADKAKLRCTCVHWIWVVTNASWGISENGRVPETKACTWKLARVLLSDLGSEFLEPFVIHRCDDRVLTFLWHVPPTNFARTSWKKILKGSCGFFLTDLAERSRTTSNALSFLHLPLPPAWFLSCLLFLAPVTVNLVNVNTILSPSLYLLYIQTRPPSKCLFLESH